MKPLLEVKKLCISTKVGEKLVPLIYDVNFDIFPGETVALLGETGAGKSITALSILQLLSPNLFFNKESEIRLEGKNLFDLAEIHMRKIRGGKISIVFQEPMTSFNPVFTIGKQIEEVLKYHRKFKGKKLKEETYQLLEIVHVGDVRRIYESYPHQLSGGMKQRAMIAMALSAGPKLLIADEPTTALDVITEAQILSLLKNLQVKYNLSIILITHNLTVAAKMADKIIVMQRGRIVEQGTSHVILNNPTHFYTKKLISAKPDLQKPPLLKENETLLSVEKLKVHFPIKNGLFNKTIDVVRALEDISFSIKEGETLAVIGESGCGKTTLAKTIVSLIKPTDGNIVFLGETLNKLNVRQLRKRRQEFQIIFQDPFSAIDPRFQVRDILEEGMLALGIGSDASEREERIDFLLEQVGLSSDYKYRYPHQLSGGQRQRVCIARALAVGPRLLVCDEPTSSLDVTVQAKIIDLLIELQKEYEIAYLFITHNINIVPTIAHNVVIMKEGRIVEYGAVDRVFNAPRHPYTRALLDNQFL